MKALQILLLCIAWSTGLFAQEKPATDSLKKDSLQTKQLREVSIRNIRKMTERKTDRTILHLNGQNSWNGLDAYMLLEELPGVRLSSEGSINLMGKGATVYIDGKPTYLSGTDLAAYLRSLPAGQLAKIELMPNPPARYDAAGSGGIINILTRKDGLPGYHAGLNLSVGSGRYRKLNGSANVSYRAGKLNLFLNAGAGAPKDFDEGSGTRLFSKDQQSGQSVLLQQNHTDFSRSSKNLKLGADYYLSQQTTFGFITSLNQNRVSEFGLNGNQMYGPGLKLDSSVSVLTQTRNLFKSASLNLNMAHRFDTTGTELSLDVDRSRFHTSSGQLFSNTALSASGISLGSFSIRGELPRQIDISAVKTDFNQTISGFQFGAGLKYSSVETDNTAGYFTDAGNGEQVDFNRSNTFRYRENITAAYTELGREYRRFGFKAGLRAERTGAKGHQPGNVLQRDSAFSNDYTSWFPTLFLSWKPDSAGRHQLYLNFGRRINRPGYEKLNPFLTTLQRYNQESGNPFLLPDYARTVELSHNYKDRLNTSIYHSRLSNISSAITTAEGDVYVKRPVNAGNLQITGAMIGYNSDLLRWWNMDISLNPERVSLRMAFDGIRVDTSFWAHSVNWFNRMSFSKSLTGEIVLNYGSGTFTGQYASKGMAALRAGLRKTCMGGNLGLGISGSDLFYSAISRGRVVNVKNSSASYRSSKDSRTLVLSFSYRISHNAKDNKRLRDRNGVREEQNRVGSL